MAQIKAMDYATARPLVEIIVALHSGIDTIAAISRGVYSKTYGASAGGNIANLFVTFGLLEDAPDVELPASGSKGIRTLGLSLIMR